MRRRCNDPHRQIAEIGRRRLPCVSRPNAIARFTTGFVVFWLSLTWQISQPWAQIVSSPRELAIIRINVLDLLVHEQSLPLPVKQRRDALWEYYQEFGGELLWLGSRRPNELLARLQNAASDGLDPKDYPSKQLAGLAAAKSTDDKRSLALVELFFSAAFLEYASDIKVGRFLPRKVDPNFFIEGRTLDQTAALKSLASADSLDRFFSAWQPSNPRYAALRSALANYLALADKAVARIVGRGAKPGTKDPGCPLLYETEADGRRQPSSTNQKSRRRWSTCRDPASGFESDGVIELHDRCDECRPGAHPEHMAMERCDGCEDLGQQYVIVNIAGFDLRRINGGNVEEHMAVVVGKPYTRTPVFSDRIRYVEFNPYWTVPPGIAANEELPKLRKNPASLAAQGFEIVRGNQVIDPTSIDWSRYAVEISHFRFDSGQAPIMHWAT
jgi:murein L,D-transpeptidase YcbB/YkuD